MNMAQREVKGSITRCTPVSSSKKKGEEGCTHTYKLALIQLVGTEKKSFSNKIMRELLLNLKKRANGFGVEITSGYPKN